MIFVIILIDRSKGKLKESFVAKLHLFVLHDHNNNNGNSTTAAAEVAVEATGTVSSLTTQRPMTHKNRGYGESWPFMLTDHHPPPPPVLERYCTMYSRVVTVQTSWPTINTFQRTLPIPTTTHFDCGDTF